MITARRTRILYPLDEDWKHWFVLRVCQMALKLFPLNDLGAMSMCMAPEIGRSWRVAAVHEMGRNRIVRLGMALK